MSEKSRGEIDAEDEMDKLRIISGVGGDRLADGAAEKRKPIMERVGLAPEDLAAQVKGDPLKACRRAT